jgi:hypothetical protein
MFFVIGPAFLFPALKRSGVAHCLCRRHSDAWIAHAQETQLPRRGLLRFQRLRNHVFSSSILAAPVSNSPVAFAVG